MIKKEDIENIMVKAENLLDTESNYVVIINKTNHTIVISDKFSSNNVGVWSSNENSITYGNYTFSKATALAKIFQDLCHIECREEFGLRTTHGSDDRTKAF